MSSGSKRTNPTAAAEAEVLTASRRRCCLCYYLVGKRDTVNGQVAHLNKKRSDSRFENLVFLCLDHHSQYDSTTRQHKNLTETEIRTWRDRLYKELGTSHAINNSGSNPPLSNSGDWNELLEHAPNSVSFAFAENADLTYHLRRTWRLTLTDEQQPFLFAFTAPSINDGICRLLMLELPDDRVAVICEQIEENPGMSVTNAVEAIAFQVCAKFGIEPNKLVWIEHYEPYLDLGYQRVRFGIIPPTGLFGRPKWQPMTDREWARLHVTKPEGSGPIIWETLRILPIKKRRRRSNRVELIVVDSE